MKKALLILLFPVLVQAQTGVMVKARVDSIRALSLTKVVYVLDTLRARWVRMDTLYVGGGIGVAGHILPSLASTYDVGSLGLPWKAIHGDSVFTDNIKTSAASTPTLRLLTDVVAIRSFRPTLQLRDTVHGTNNIKWRGYIAGIDSAAATSWYFGDPDTTLHRVVLNTPLGYDFRTTVAGRMIFHLDTLYGRVGLGSDANQQAEVTIRGNGTDLWAVSITPYWPILTNPRAGSIWTVDTTGVTQQEGQATITDRALVVGNPASVQVKDTAHAYNENAFQSFYQILDMSGNTAYLMGDDVSGAKQISHTMGQGYSGRFFAGSLTWLRVDSIARIGFGNISPLTSSLSTFHAANTYGNIAVMQDSRSNNVVIIDTTGLSTWRSTLTVKPLALAPKLTLLSLQASSSTNGVSVDSTGKLSATGLITTTDSAFVTKGIRTNADIWKSTTAYTNPDYVFEDYYQGASSNPKYVGLMPLDSLDAHLKAMHRLPGIPDRPTGAFERLDIALEKIEQLTLYAIEQDKRIKQLEAKLKQN